MQTILVTGGAGYIGSHTVLQLLESGNQVIVLDNLCNSSQESLNRVEELTGKKTIFVQGDIRDHTILELLFSKHKINAVIHFAGLKAVGESVAKPLNYYNNNVYGTLTLCEAMKKFGVKICFATKEQFKFYITLSGKEQSEFLTNSEIDCN